MAVHPYERGTVGSGTLGVSIDAFQGSDYVAIELGHGDTDAHLTAEQALELAADLLTHANALRKHAQPPGEGKIRRACGHCGSQRWTSTDGVNGTCHECGITSPLAAVPSEEDLIRDAMTEAKQHPGRIVTR